MSNQIPGEVSITRLFDAPRALVFKALTDSSLVAQWWGPRYFTNPFCALDARPGGSILIHMLGPDGVMLPNKGVFQEIVPPERLVFTSCAFEDEPGSFALETLITITLAEVGDKTQLSLHAVVTHSTPAVAEALAGMEEGWSQSLDKLAYLLAHPGGQPAPAPAGLMRGAGKSALEIDGVKREIVMTRVFDAPRELVFQVFTEPKLVPHWWGPRGLTTVVDKLELKPGGAWRYVQHDDHGNEYGFHGAYWQITPPERLVYTFEWEGRPGHELLETVIFEEHEGKTRVTTIDRFQNTEDLYGMIQSGMEEGAAASFDRMTELLHILQKESRKVNS